SPHARSAKTGSQVTTARSTPSSGSATRSRSSPPHTRENAYGRKTTSWGRSRGPPRRTGVPWVSGRSRTGARSATATTREQALPVPVLRLAHRAGGLQARRACRVLHDGGTDVTTTARLRGEDDDRAAVVVEVVEGV